MSDKFKNDLIKNKEEKKYPSVSYLEELGANTAEAICASMRAANDDAPVFGPCITSVGLTNMTPANHEPATSATLDPMALAHALKQLQANALPAPFIKGSFFQPRVILGKDAKE